MSGHDSIDAEIDRLLNGGNADSVPSNLAAALDGLRSRLRAVEAPPVGMALSEFVDVDLIVDKGDLLATAASNAAGPATPQVAELPKRRVPNHERKPTRVFTVIATFIATATGKIAVGTTVALAATTGAHAVGVVDVPVLPDVGVDEIVFVDVDPTSTTDDADPTSTIVDIDSTDSTDDSSTDDSSTDDSSTDDSADGQSPGDQESGDDDPTGGDTDGGDDGSSSGYEQCSDEADAIEAAAEGLGEEAEEAAERAADAFEEACEAELEREEEAREAAEEAREEQREREEEQREEQREREEEQREREEEQREATEDDDWDDDDWEDED